MRTRIQGTMALLALAAVPGACAGSIPKADREQGATPTFKLNAADNPLVKVDAPPDVMATAADTADFASVPADKLREHRAKNPANRAGMTCTVAVTLTKFDRGKAWLRAVSAGLGQIKLAADVLVTSADGRKLDSFKIDKRSAWGSVYGAATSIENIEPAFAAGIAIALTGQSD